jgi:sigma-E factor negative regulatory protein RseA
MTEKLNEQISALLDDELSAHETDSVLSRLSQDHALRQKWDRYHLIGDAMRGEAINRDISERIRHMIEQEPTIIAIPRKKTGTWKSNWLKPAAGAALAASVAAVAIITTPGLLETNNPVQPTITATTNTTTIPASNLVAPGIQTVGAQQTVPTVTVVQQRIPGTRWKNLTEPSVENRLNGYLVDHSEYVAPGAGMGVMPYATFVGYDSKQR